MAELQLFESYSCVQLHSGLFVSYQLNARILCFLWCSEEADKLSKLKFGRVHTNVVSRSTMNT